jgi:hypothetical protein
MAIDGDISITTLVTEALKGSGRIAPTATMISDATTLQFRMVKNDLAAVSGRHHTLLTNSVTVTTDGVSRYTWPTAARELESVQLLDGPTDWTGTAQAGATTSITLANTLNITDSADVRGKFLVLTGGTGAQQIRQVISWDNSTKVAGVSSAWDTTPDATTTYLIATDHRRLWHIDHATVWVTNPVPGTRGKSYNASPVGRELWLEYAADKAYVLWWTYWAHLDRLDNAGSVLLSHIREHYNVWHQGMITKLNQRYDEDRYPAELSVYQAMLMTYEQEGALVAPMLSKDV